MTLRNPDIDQYNPPGSPYVMNRWHKDRVSIKGYTLELKALLKRPFPSNKKQKFIIFSRARSGSTLLVDLLDQIPGVKCEGEELHHAVLSPVNFLNRRANWTSESTYGCKVLSYQLIEVQKIGRPDIFFSELQKSGFTIIHLTRQTLSQCLSITIASENQLYHRRKITDEKNKAVEINIEHFTRRLMWNIKLLEYEKYIMKDIPHLSISYEKDLLSEECQQPCIDKVAKHLGVESGPVKARLSKILRHKLSDMLVNSGELVEQLDSLGMRNLIDEFESNTL